MQREELKARIEECRAKIDALNKRLFVLQEDLQSLDSKEFIRKNKLTRADVVTSTVGGKLRWLNHEEFDGATSATTSTSGTTSSRRTAPCTGRRSPRSRTAT